MADSIFVRGEGGAIIEMDLPLPEPIQERLDKGALRRVHNDGSPYHDDEPTGPPAAGASKALWIGWAVSQGADPEAAEKATKQDLIDQYGSKAE